MTEATTNSDGISVQDWGHVADLAVDLTQSYLSSPISAAKKFRRKLIRQLYRLSKTYGARASLLATLADYSYRHDIRERFLLAAYPLIQPHDLKNKTLIAESLASFYIEDQANYAQGRLWLDLLKENLQHYRYDYEYSQMLHLEEQLRAFDTQ